MRDRTRRNWGIGNNKNRVRNRREKGSMPGFESIEKPDGKKKSTGTIRGDKRRNTKTDINKVRRFDQGQQLTTQQTLGSGEGSANRAMKKKGQSEDGGEGYRERTALNFKFNLSSDQKGGKRNLWGRTMRDKEFLIWTRAT